VVSGNVNSLRRPKKNEGFGSVCSIKIDGKRYWANDQECKSLKIGHPTSIRAAGPLDDLM
jgi:hypothetical protein